MNSLLNDNSDDDVDEYQGRRDREITLGTTMILGIFFALAVFGAVCVGFGYSLGAKHTATVAGTTGTQGGGSSVFNGFKPAAGSLGAGSAKPGTVSAANVPYTAPPVVAPLPKPAAVTDHNAALAAEALAETPVRPTPVAAPVKPVAVPVSAPPAPVAAGAMMVQVAAVTHQEDADLLVSTLKRKNYSVAIHNEPQDRLLHVQVGPFASRKDADAMRQRLQADGFNAIVKDNSH